MTDTTNNGDAAPVQDQTPGPDENEPRTPPTDTAPPEEKDGESAPGDPVQNGSETDEEHEHGRGKRKQSSRRNHESHEWSYSQPEPYLVTRIQRGLGRHGFYEGPADGDFDAKSRQGVQRALERVGYSGALTGHIGEQQAELIQEFAAKFGTYVGPINKQVDTATWAGFAVALEEL